MYRFIIVTGGWVGYQIPFCKVLRYLRLTVDMDGVTKRNDMETGSALTPWTKKARCSLHHVHVHLLKITHTFHIL
jgi:hypothetical protein